MDDRINVRNGLLADSLLWMAPALQGLILRVLALGRVQSSVRPVCAVAMLTAGPDGIRELGPTLLCRL